MGGDPGHRDRPGPAAHRLGSPPRSAAGSPATPVSRCGPDTTPADPGTRTAHRRGHRPARHRRVALTPPGTGRSTGPAIRAGGQAGQPAGGCRAAPGRNGRSVGGDPGHRDRPGPAAHRLGSPPRSAAGSPATPVSRCGPGSTPPPVRSWCPYSSSPRSSARTSPARCTDPPGTGRSTGPAIRAGGRAEQPPGRRRAAPGWNGRSVGGDPGHRDRPGPAAHRLGRHLGLLPDRSWRRGDAAGLAVHHRRRGPGVPAVIGLHVTGALH